VTQPPARSPKFPLRLQAVGTAAKAAKVATNLQHPQRPVAHAPAHAHVHPHAHRDAARRLLPDGLGMDSDDVRKRMAQRLRALGVVNEAVLAAMARVPRHRFVDTALVTQAYEDTSLPIGHGQTISKPSVVARMVELLFGGVNARRAGHLGRVLEVGTGCGYQAAVLAALGQQVVSVERLKPLHDKARELLAPLRPAHLRLVYGDGMLGHPPNAPYDSIIAAAGGDALPPAWLDQLAVGGRLVSPLRRAGTQQQVLVVVDRTEHGCEHTVFEAVKFVPLRSGLGA
jgi:protein-L-isoaspartate(D-aspartate) O-methyltransferase